MRVASTAMGLSGVRQENLAEFPGGAAAIHFAAETIAHEQRQATAVVDMRMGKDDGIHRDRVHRQWLPVPQPQLLQALEQSAVHQDAALTRADQIFRTGDRAGRAEECELHPVR
jgi:hypothetical protein